MSTRPARSSRMSTKAPTPVALGTGVSVMLTKIRTKIRQTANQFRRTKRRTSTSDSLTPSIVSIPVELTLPYSRPTLSQSSLISQDMVAEEDAWWMRDRQSHPPFVSGVASWATPLPSPLDLEDPSFTIPCWPVEQVVECSSFDGRQMDTASYSSSFSQSTSFSVPSSQSTLSESIHTVEGSTRPSLSAASSPTQLLQTDDSRSHNRHNATPTDIPMYNANDFEDDTPDANDALPYYGTRLIPLPSTPLPTPGPDAKCEGIKRHSQQLPASTSLAYTFDGPELCVTISAPSESESAHHNLAVDNLFKVMATQPDVESIDINVPSGCDNLSYATKLLKDVLSVLLGCTLSPNSIALRLPVLETDTSGRAPLVLVDAKPPPSFRKIVGDALSEGIHYHGRSTSPRSNQIFPLPRWWCAGRLGVPQLTSLTLAYPLPLDDFLELLSYSKNLEVVSVGRLIQPERVATSSTVSPMLLNNLSSLSVVSDIDLRAFFNVLVAPLLRGLEMHVLVDGTPDAYPVQWHDLDKIYVRCKMTREVESRLVSLCEESIRERDLLKIVNLADC